MPSLNALSNSILKRVSNDTRKPNDNINIITVKKYLLMSLRSILLLENNTLFKRTCLGLEWETNSLNENLVKRNIFKNLSPELVETKEPPTITNIKNIKLFWE